MKTLILTEKPSVARDFAKALGVSGKNEGFLENGDMIITWAVGHLVELLEPQDYSPQWKGWRLDTLPILPPEFRYKPIAGTKKQFEIIQKLLRRKPREVVIATDAGREGELIARSTLQLAGFNDWTNAKRFWSSLALTPTVIQEGMRSIRPASDFDRLWRAGRARQIADWLVGMNVSRAATLRLNDLYSVGRVQTAVLSLIVDRRREREQFKPEPYWILQATFKNEKGTWIGAWFREEVTRFLKEEEARQVAVKIQGKTGTVRSIDKQKKKQPPPLLYSLTDLQQDANRKYGFSAQKTLETAQILYEKLKCLSYPRTDSKVLGSKNVDLAQNLITRLSGVYTPIFAGIDKKLVNVSNKRVFNDAKLTDHHALIPLAPLPGNAGEDEKKIYWLVTRRFAAAFHPDCEYEQTEIITGVENESFRTRGKRILKPGWRVVYETESAKPPAAQGDPEEEQDDLPPLAKGDPALVEETTVTEKQTTPPPEYTEALLLKDMTNPSRYVTDEELKKIYKGDIGLGTQATRAQIIETLLARRYIERQNKYLIATDKGCHLIDTLRKLDVSQILASARETARWEIQLDQIAQGRGSDQQFLEEIQQFVQKAVQEFKTSPIQVSPVQEIGTCPQCGGRLIEGKKGFGCSNWKPEKGGCTFVIWKKIAGKKITHAMVKELLETKRLGPVKGFISKSHNRFAATLKLVQENDKWTVVMDFESKPDAPVSKALTKKPSKTFGTCPACGGKIIEGKKGYGCSNWKPEKGGCKFVIWKTIAGHAVPKKAITQLLTQRITDVLDGFKSKTGKRFSARLTLEDHPPGPPRVVFDFSGNPSKSQDEKTRKNSDEPDVSDPSGESM